MEAEQRAQAEKRFKDAAEQTAKEQREKARAKEREERRQERATAKAKATDLNAAETRSRLSPQSVSELGNLNNSTLRNWVFLLTVQEKSLGHKLGQNQIKNDNS